MRIAVGVANLVLGCVYTSYGLMTIADMKRGWRTMGFSHFGAAWIAMAFTCGPHHLDHAIHTLVLNRSGGSLDLIAVLVGAPAGIAWFLLRIEAFRGGRGDRALLGSPAWVRALPGASGIYAVALVSALVVLLARGAHLSAALVPNTVLFGYYMMIGYYLLRTQLQNHQANGGWSLSGLSLTVVFPTCALMHAVYTTYAMTGVYDFDTHLRLIDWLGIPAAAYFLWVVQRLHREALRDWNRAETRTPVLAG